MIVEQIKQGIENITIPKDYVMGWHKEDVEELERFLIYYRRQCLLVVKQHLENTK